jgi:SAM-dependent methyltransferase
MSSPTALNSANEVRIASDDAAELDPWFARELVCPRDKSDLHRDGDHLICMHHHSYPIADGVPIMLVDDVPQTLPDLTQRTLAGAVAINPVSGVAESNSIEPFVRQVLVGTNGNLYGRIAGKLPRYPIPEIRLPRPREGARDLLDVGCNWGRWTIAAARKGYHPVGMDPGLESILPARRIARRLGVEARFLVGDARYLPFRAGRFEVVYSYGVLQHFAPDDARLAIAEAARVAAPRGRVLIQMAARYGLLSILSRRAADSAPRAASRCATGSRPTSRRRSKVSSARPAFRPTDTSRSIRSQAIWTCCRFMRAKSCACPK